MITNGMNFEQFINFLKGSSNPEQIVYQVIQSRVGNNPFFMNLLNIAQSNRPEDVLEIARNTFREKGLDFDKEFNSFKKNLKL